MGKATFYLPKNKALLNPDHTMGDEEGIYFSFKSDMDAIARIVPPQLKPAMPIVSGYIVDIRKPAFAKPYREAMLGVYVDYQGTVGMYPIAFLLDGDGTEMAILPGREQFGLPKKSCGSDGGIRIERDGDRLHGIAERRGVRLMDVSIKLGKYNDPTCGQLYFDPEPGKRTGGTSFYYTYAIEPDEKGDLVFARTNLLVNELEYHYETWLPGEVSVQLESSVDDPWGELPVLESLGGALSCNTLEMQSVRIAERPDPAEVMPYLMTTRYDSEALL